MAFSITLYLNSSFVLNCHLSIFTPPLGIGRIPYQIPPRGDILTLQYYDIIILRRNPTAVAQPLPRIRCLPHPKLATDGQFAPLPPERSPNDLPSPDLCSTMRPNKETHMPYQHKTQPGSPRAIGVKVLKPCSILASSPIFG